MPPARESFWPGNWFQPPHRLLILFLAITLVLAVALGMLSWRLIDQDRALESQRTQERLDHVADLASAALLRSLSQIEEQLDRLMALSESQLSAAAEQCAKQLCDDDAVIVVSAPSGLESYPKARLLYYPFVALSKEPPVAAFARGETLEFQLKDHAKAIAVFRELARSEDVAIRAGALLRLARNLRKAGETAAALAAYDELALLGSTPIEELPAELLSRHARCVILDQLNERPRLQQEAGSLEFDLRRAKWQLTRAAYRFYTDEARRWLGRDQNGVLGQDVGEEDGLALTGGAESLWEEWQRTKRGEGNPTGRASLWNDNRSVLLLWRNTPDRLVGMVAGPRYFERRWQTASQLSVDSQGVQVALTDAEGHQVLGRLEGVATQQALRTAADTRLPWTLHVVSTDPRIALLGGRRVLLLTGLAMTAMVVLVGCYFIARSVTRELEVARIQSEFVSAVSHEFRTPLSSICQLSELLADGRVTSEQRRNEYYEGLQRESQRLHRLVEGLLDFGRMEAGARAYRFKLCEPSALVRQVGEEFAQEVKGRGYQIEITANNHLPSVRADAEAFSRALWNLLDNAVKYSPHCQTIWVDAEREADQVAIRVRDKGLGIGPGENQKIFEKFVRGASAQAAGTKGTGLGLAMVRHIALAHGGQVRVESQPDIGTTFTILLPKAKG